MSAVDRVPQATRAREVSTGPLLLTRHSRLDARLDLPKWLATVAMVLDHVALMFADQVPHAAFRAIGRLAWPLLAWVIAVRLAQKPARAGGYLRRCLAWGVISQPVHWLALEFEPGAFNPFAAPLNIFFTIATGIVLWEVARRWPVASSGQTRVTLIMVAVAALVASWWPHGVDYGPVGAGMVPAIALAAQRSLPGSTAVAGLAGALTGVTLVYPFIDIMTTTYVMVFAVAPAAAGCVAWLCLQQRRGVARLPGTLFYAFFPAHLTLLLILRAWLERSP